MLRLLSLGLGVQSSTMALMSSVGDLPMPDGAIFADTGWEPKSTYEQLERLRAALPFPVYVVSAGNLRADLETHARERRRIDAVPWHLGDGGMGRRQCTKEYKLTPIRRKVRELLDGKTPKGGCEMWIGISTDEIMRMKQSLVGYIVNRFPLVEKLMSRRDCIRWLTEHGYAIPAKSACIGCPYHNDHAWRAMRDERPEEWADAVKVDEMIRKSPRMKLDQFMHRQRVPLAQVDLRTPEEQGQLSLFLNECEGMCGV